KTGKNESQVIKIMRRNLKPSSFRLWRKRVHKTSIKHRKKFKLERKKMREKIRISDIY
ncbi:TIGR03643 family protein, partial [Pelagibacteraceae bacterium]|nr:TIGR03643 family protein [Pelagibacteraceae bacterium]